MSQAMAAYSSGRREAYYRKERLGELLAATVRKMQWSYAIFWSNFTRQQRGALTWSDGYYNGDIKARKTALPLMEFRDNPMGLQRSEQLRELYVFLSADDGKQQATRPRDSLTPEDLTDTEWYYVLCMSYTFTPGQCLPGRALVNTRHIWLTNAEFADAELFTRSLLAKSASIQTVVCFPFMDGVIELGTTELVLEDPAILQQIVTSLFEAPVSAISEQCLFISSTGDRDGDILCPHLDYDIVESPIASNHDAAAASRPPVENVHPSCFPFTLHSLASNEQKSNGVEVREMNKSVCKEVNAVSSGNLSFELCAGEKNDDDDDSFITEGSNDASQAKTRDDDFRSILYGSMHSNDFISASFVNLQRMLRHSSPESRGMIKKISMPDSVREGNYISALYLERDDTRYWKDIVTVLRYNQVEKASLLGDTIEHLTELEKRVEDFMKLEIRGRRKHPGVAERNSCSKGIRDVKKSRASKRKFCNKVNDDAEAKYNHWILAKDAHANVNVTVRDKEVMIDMHCPWRDCLLMEAVKSMRNLHLDPFSVQSSVVDGIVELSIKSKFMESVVASPGTIKRALRRVVAKY